MQVPPFRTLNTLPALCCTFSQQTATRTHSPPARPDRLFFSPCTTSEFTAREKRNAFYTIFTRTCSFTVLISYYTIVANYLDVTSTWLVYQKHARSAASVVLMRPYTADRIAQLLKQIRTWIMGENFLFTRGTPVQKVGTCLAYIPKE